MSLIAAQSENPEPLQIFAGKAVAMPRTGIM